MLLVVPHSVMECCTQACIYTVDATAAIIGIDDIESQDNDPVKSLEVNGTRLDWTTRTRNRRLPSWSVFARTLSVGKTGHEDSGTSMYENDDMLLSWEAGERGASGLLSSANIWFAGR